MSIETGKWPQAEKGMQMEAEEDCLQPEAEEDQVELGAEDDDVSQVPADFSPPENYTDSVGDGALESEANEDVFPPDMVASDHCQSESHPTELEAESIRFLVGLWDPGCLEGQYTHVQA